MKLTTIVLLSAATLGSASPVSTNMRSTPARDGQGACDCSRTFYGNVHMMDSECPAGYENVSPWNIISCKQTGCRGADYEARCGKSTKGKQKVEEKTSAPAPSASASASPPSKSACKGPARVPTPVAGAAQPSQPATGQRCDCSKTFLGNVDFVSAVECPDGYKIRTPATTMGISCVQVDCDSRVYEAKCGRI